MMGVGLYTITSEKNRPEPQSANAHPVDGGITNADVHRFVGFVTQNVEVIGPRPSGDTVIGCFIFTKKGGGQ